MRCATAASSRCSSVSTVSGVTKPYRARMTEGWLVGPSAAPITSSSNIFSPGCISANTTPISPSTARFTDRPPSQSNDVPHQIRDRHSLAHIGQEDVPTLVHGLRLQDELRRLWIAHGVARDIRVGHRDRSAALSLLEDQYDATA